MPFDSGFTAGVVWELNAKTAGGKIEKVYMPTDDEIVLAVHTQNGALRLSLSASPHMPKVGITTMVKENPAVPSAFCMHMRKHLTGCKIREVHQPDFERVIDILLDGYDELGYPTAKHLYIEIMGKCSNIVLTNGEGKIINLIRPVDFTTSSKRQLLPGTRYELPPKQDKLDPYTESPEGFAEAMKQCDADAEKFLMRYRGFSPLIAREIAYRAASLGKRTCECSPILLYNAFDKLICDIKECRFTPCILLDGKKPVDLSFCEIKQYGELYTQKSVSDFGTLTDMFYGERESGERIKQRTRDIFKLLTNAEARLKKKIANQMSELEECREKDKYRIWGELIKANIHSIPRGACSLEAMNYYLDDCPMIKIPLDGKLSAVLNSQKYFKKYAKLKSAETELKKQIELSHCELEYIYTVFDSLTKATDEGEILQIRAELYESGYASRMKNTQSRKIPKTKPLHFRTSGGYDVFVGKNNTQNDELTLKTASKKDWFFHVKNAPGSHVIMICDGEEPSAEDFTQAAELAAFYSSKKDGKNTEVDYTLVKNVKKPSGAKPGLVIYHTNYSATVTPDEDRINALKA